MSSYSLPEQLYYMIRFYNVEMAEDFFRRAAGYVDFHSIYTFVDNMLMQYPRLDTGFIRLQLQTHSGQEHWVDLVRQHLIPFLRSHGLPRLTDQAVNSFYGLEC